MAKLTSINPVNGEELGSVKLSTKADVESAVATAKEGFADWSAETMAKRAQILKKLASLIKKDKQRLAELITKEMGKPLTEALDEVNLDLDFIDYTLKIAPKVLADEKLANLKNGKEVSLIHYPPIGVVGVIKPWNFPLDVAMWALLPALLAGNAVVFKPASEVPLFSEELVKLFWQAGVPKKALQLLQGRSQVGEMLVDSEVDMISFTGSTAVGQEIAKKCAATFKKCVLEMGGSSPAIVAADADLDLAVKAIVWGRFFNSGQSCDSIKRVFVETKVAQKFTDKVVKAVEKLRIGDPSQKDIDLGPLASQKQLKTLQDQVTRGVVQSGRIITGGRRMREEPFMSGWYHEPTVMVYVNQKMDIMQEEVFGPVLPICEVASFQAAIKGANNNPYGLSAAVFTKDKAKMDQALRDLKAGMIYQNEAIAILPGSPWYGVKQSATGVARGKWGLLEYVHKQHLFFNKNAYQDRPYWFPY